jgi:hypothetical protein
MRPLQSGNNTDRLIARALREAQDEPPTDFAAQTAALVFEAAQVHRGLNDRLESRLQWAVIAALIAAAGVTLLWMGDRALASLASIGSAGWLYAVATCVILSLALQHLMQRSE